MEASERPQLSFGEAAGDGSVRALDDRLVIERLEVDDARAARLVRDRGGRGARRAETVRKAIEIGSRVLDSEATAANVDYVRRELEQGLGELDSRLGDTLEAERRGARRRRSPPPSAPTATTRCRRRSRRSSAPRPASTARS